MHNSSKNVFGIVFVCLIEMKVIKITNKEELPIDGQSGKFYIGILPVVVYSSYGESTKCLLNVHKEGCSVPIFPKDDKLVLHEKSLDTVFLQMVIVEKSVTTRKKDLLTTFFER